MLTSPLCRRGLYPVGQAQILSCCLSKLLEKLFKLRYIVEAKRRDTVDRRFEVETRSVAPNVP